ncbi:MAG TPA: polysaccharide biosynthesis/export family protein, partial [Terriglobales bacterium]|nr:polysaccharide biosynthesis/export family protein [Terriglobales bacterium]
RMMRRYRLSTCLFLAAMSFQAHAQETQPPPGATPVPAVPGQMPGPLPADSIRPDYVLGPNDQILIRAPGAEELTERPFRIDSEGYVNLPLVGRVRAGGLTVRELEAELTKRLREFIVQPKVIITVVQFRSEPVFFVGAFARPGIYALQGRRTLVEMLASIGGLVPSASRRITVTRRAEYGVIPLPSAIEDPEKKISTVEISMASLRNNVNPAEDITLQPFDVISVERAELVYVNGEVARVAGIELNERDSVSVAQALTLAGGFTRDAKRSKVRILRPILNTTRRAEIEIDASRIFKGEENDIPLLPNDILFVPRSYSHLVWTTLGQIALPTIPYIIFTFAR